MSRLLGAAGRFPAAAALLVTLLWSSSWVLIKLGLDDLPPLTFAGLRYSAAAAILLALLVSTRANREAVRAMSWRAHGVIALFGLVLYTMTQGAQFVGLSLLPAATLSLLLALTPVCVAVVARWWLTERAQPGQRLGLAVALAGAVVYLAPDVGLTSGAGLLVGVFALASNSGSVVLGRAVNRAAHLPVIVITALSMTVGGLLTLAAGLLFEPAPTFSPGSVLILAWLAVVNTAFAFTLWNHTQRRLSAVVSSAINTTMLVQIALLGWVFLDETISPVQWVGIALTTLGVFRIQRG